MTRAVLSILFVILITLLPHLLPEAAWAEQQKDAHRPTLDQAVATALAENPQLRAVRAKWEAAKQKVPQAKSLEDPMIGVDVERMDTTRLDTFTANEWMISQKLPWFGKRGARASVAAREAEVVGFRYLELERNVQARVIGAYWDLWLAQRSVEITAEHRAWVEQFEQVALRRYETGQALQADVLRAQMELAKMTNELVTMQREVPVAEAALNKLLNADSDQPRSVDRPPETPRITLTLTEIQERARQYCCILLSFLRSVEAREAAVRAAKLESAPDVEFRVEARQFNGRSGIQEVDTGVFLNFPWLWRGKYQAMVAEAEAELEMARGELEEELNMTMFEVKELFTRADIAQRLMDLYETTVLPQARELVASTRVGYESGRSTFLELVEAQRELLDAQLQSDRGRAEYGRAHALLDQFIAPWTEREFATGLVTPNMK